MAINVKKKLARLNKALALAANASSSSRDQIQSSRSSVQLSELKPNMNPDSMLRKCEGCGNTFPSFDMPIFSVGDICFPHFICDSCKLLTPEQRGHEKAPYWSAILNYWKPQFDFRAVNFIVLDQHSTALLCCLHELSKHYTWDQVTIMVNSMVMERLRHGAKKSCRHYAVEADFFDVYEACKHLKFYNTMPEHLQVDELKGAKLILSHFGLVIPEPGTEGGDHASICSQGWMCPNILPCRDRIIFTYAYRNRLGCDVRATEAGDSKK
ncbi:hypothetical protein F4805DRAFT_454117 [Annulohypoxylon moriforme]|nr:hypothetical protein F4805DRAFT_454117 [Annulohypoxylon moriforme]